MGWLCNWVVPVFSFLCIFLEVLFRRKKKKKNSATGTIISQENLGIKLLPDLI